MQMFMYNTRFILQSEMPVSGCHIVQSPPLHDSRANGQGYADCPTTNEI
jgi:hypothetical protein